MSSMVLIPIYRNKGWPQMQPKDSSPTQGSAESLKADRGLIDGTRSVQ